MGIKIFSSSSLDTTNGSSNSSENLPRADRWKILKYLEIGDYLIISLNYEDCSNYEGNKILVFKSTLKKITHQKYIDPHFSDNKKYIHPIARFIPTEEGWDMAVKLVNNLNDF